MNPELPPQHLHFPGRLHCEILKYPRQRLDCSSGGFQSLKMNNESFMGLLLNWNRMVIESLKQPPEKCGVLHHGVVLQRASHFISVIYVGHSKL